MMSSFKLHQWASALSGGEVHTEESCSICLELLLHNGTAIATLPCLHRLHAKCLSTIRSTAALAQACPLCRSPLPPTPQDLHAASSNLYFPLKAKVEAREKGGQLAWESLEPEEQAVMDEVVELWRCAAEQGEPLAQCHLGFLYRKGRGVACDLVESVRWYQLAAAAGSANAMCNLGLAYFSGKGVEGGKDDAHAAKWYRLSAQLGFATAQFNLGLMCAHHNPAAAPAAAAPPAALAHPASTFAPVLALATSAAVFGPQDAALPQEEDGAARTETDSGTMVDTADADAAAAASEEGGEEGEDEEEEALRRRQDFAQIADSEALKWYTQAAVQGHADAQVNLGSLYYQGRGIHHHSNVPNPAAAAAARQESLGEALKWYSAAAAQGQADALCNLGILFEEGEGVKADPCLAKILLRKAALKGHPAAAFSLGAMFERQAASLRTTAAAASTVTAAAAAASAAATNTNTTNNTAAINVNANKTPGAATAPSITAAPLSLPPLPPYPPPPAPTSRCDDPNQAQLLNAPTTSLHRMEDGSGDTSTQVASAAVAAAVAAVATIAAAGSAGDSGKTHQTNPSGEDTPTSAEVEEGEVDETDLRSVEAEAARWFLVAANAGLAVAQHNMGLLCFEGRGGVARNFPEARRWYKLAAGQGHVDAMVNLALMLEAGQGVKRDGDEGGGLGGEESDAACQAGGVDHGRGGGVGFREGTALRRFVRVSQASSVSRGVQRGPAADVDGSGSEAGGTNDLRGAQELFTCAARLGDTEAAGEAVRVAKLLRLFNPKCFAGPTRIQLA